MTDSPPAVTQQLTAVVDETLDGDVDWEIEESNDGCRLVLSDRILEINHRKGPTETIRWVLSLQADGDTVSKFGPYESVDGLCEQLQTVLTSDVFYTVCCDG